ncbi:fumarylacetoacetase [Streptomyces malaysiensis]|uniref:fumarylacetoacetase n=1 Tax=Streptomyces malaysiensis TaxID=92644 RepID=UPI003713F459
MTPSSGHPATVVIDVPEQSLYGTGNLPYGVFSPLGGAPRAGVRIGDWVLDLAVLLDDDVFTEPTLNAFMAQGHQRWAEVRTRIQQAVAGPVPGKAVHAHEAVRMHLPFAVADYVDFYASEHHARNVGRIFRPTAEPLLPNWRRLPIGYHGRAGTVIVSGTGITRPRGQRKEPAADQPTYGDSHRLDIEAEVGFVVGTGSSLGVPVPSTDFSQHVFGVVLVNDWSARDIQAWEYMPLGPFLGKSFATSVSPWIVPLQALEAARVPGVAQDPQPLPYLREEQPWGLDIQMSITWNGHEVSRPPYRTMYWSPSQMLAHMTANGARLRTGDLYASGTVSGPDVAERGSFIELTWNGSEPVQVGRQTRRFLEDGDEVVITATAPGCGGNRVGFGEVRGRVGRSVCGSFSL